EDGGDQITKSSVSSIQAVSIWETTPDLSLDQFLADTLPPVDYSLQPAAVIRRCGGWRNGCTGLSLQEWLPSGAY
ncbi:hypothetical protein ACEUAE_21040, partial [Aeromonas veronii]